MKSIMVHAGGDNAFESRLQAGLDLARRFHGHMSLILPRPTQDYVAFDMFGGAHFVAEAFEAAEKEREKLCMRIDARLQAEDVPWDWQIFDGTTSDALINAGRLADVLVMSLDPAGTAGTARAWISDVVTASRTPVLATSSRIICPHFGNRDGAGAIPGHRRGHLLVASRHQCRNRRCRKRRSERRGEAFGRGEGVDTRLPYYGRLRPWEMA